LSRRGLPGRPASFIHGRARVRHTDGGGGHARQGWHRFEGIPIFDTVAEAVRQTGANASVIYVPPPFAADAIMEATDAGLPLVVCITEGIPVMDMVRVKRFLEGRSTRLIDRTARGSSHPGSARSASCRATFTKRGMWGWCPERDLDLRGRAPVDDDRAGTVHVHWNRWRPIAGTGFVDALRLFQADPGTDAVVLIGEIGGTAEEQAAEFVRDRMTKPVVAFVAGQTAPKGRRMGHAGAIIAGGRGTGRTRSRHSRRRA